MSKFGFLRARKWKKNFNINDTLLSTDVFFPIPDYITRGTWVVGRTLYIEMFMITSGCRGVRVRREGCSPFVTGLKPQLLREYSKIWKWCLHTEGFIVYLKRMEKDLTHMNHRILCIRNGFLRNLKMKCSKSSMCD